MNILMVAAENGALAGGKVGGMGDVIRDVPRAIARLGHNVDGVMPGYQRFSLLAEAQRIGEVAVHFRRQIETVEIYRLESTADKVGCWILEHPGFAPQKKGAIYCNDSSDRPFATDASKFALFCAAVCESLQTGLLGEYQVVHLHDWHAALVAVLAKYEPRFTALQSLRLVYSIHNLALQGIRPIAGDDSALESWFPYLRFDWGVIVDPRYGNCFNPTRAAINLCHMIHTVSPTYAGEIQRPNDPGRGFHGGEGLEADLRRAAAAHRLVGILNGCEYSDDPGKAKGVELWPFLELAQRQVDEWVADSEWVPNVHYLAQRKISALMSAPRAPKGVITSIGRLTTQKVQLLTVPLSDNQTCMDRLLDSLPPDYLVILLGSGDGELEQFFARVSVRHDNLLFLRGFSEYLADPLYALGDLFLMPSSFEPCGISQMLAMRAGQPCLVHGVGGLADTVLNGVDGFSFEGEGPLAQAQALIELLPRILETRDSDAGRWQTVVDAAKNRRFLWQHAAERYCKDLYGLY